MERFARHTTLAVFLFFVAMSPAAAVAGPIVPLSISGVASIGYDPVPVGDARVVVTAPANDPVNDVSLFIDDVQITSANTADLTLDHKSSVDDSTIAYSAFASVELSPSTRMGTSGAITFSSDFEIDFSVSEISVFSLDYLFDGTVGTFAGSGYLLHLEAAGSGGLVDVVEPDGTNVPGAQSSLGTTHRSEIAGGILDGAFGGLILPGEYTLVAGLDLAMDSSPEPSNFNAIDLRLSVAAIPEPTAALVFVTGASIMASALRRDARSRRRGSAAPACGEPR